MRVCPTCSARYEAPAQYCQRDGIPLRIEQEARDPYLGTKILGQFRLERVIGSGGMGIVYSGWDEGLGRRVAVKILHRDLVTNRDVVARFHREAQIAHQLDHANIVRLILFGQLTDGNLYLVLEYLEGPTLLGALDRDGPMSAARGVKICSSVADAIGYAHRRDIVHRDLKPENIMLISRDGDPDHPKVLDFGIAKMLIGGDTLVTQAGLIFGTARYISPEGAQGDPVDKRSDVYSLGVISYQMLSGTTPFESTEPVQLLLKHIHETPPPLRSHAAARTVSPALEAVIMRSLAKSPAARYGDGSSFARALRDAMADSDPNSAIRSMIPTAAMPMYVQPHASMGTPAAGQSSMAALISPSVAHLADPGSGVRPYPVAPVSAAAGSQSTMMAGSPGGALATVPSASSGPYAALNGSGYAAMPVAPALTATQPAMMQHFTGPSHAVYAPPVAQVGVVPGRRADGDSGRFPPSGGTNNSGLHAPSTVAATAPLSQIAPVDAEDEEISIPGLRTTRKKAGTPSARSGVMVTIVASVLVTAVLGLGAVWALGLYPSQRRDNDVRDLMYRADDAFRGHRYVHQDDENDVEDLTDAVLAISPGFRRALDLRSAAAVLIRNQAVELRNAGHPDQALPMLHRATLLSNDAEIRDLVAQLEREAQSPPPPATTAAATLATSPTHTTPHVSRPRSQESHPQASQTEGPAVTNTPVQAVPSGGPTFTPGRDPSVATPPRQNRPAIMPGVHPVIQPAQDPPGMSGGPSQTDNSQRPAPQSDPNTGGVAF